MKKEKKCKFILENGDECSAPILPGTNVCWQHASSDERKKHQNSRQKNSPQRKKKPAQQKEYNGYLPVAETEHTDIGSDGKIYGYYGTNKLTAEERRFLQEAPIGKLEDEIRALRMLAKMAFKKISLDDQGQLPEKDAWQVYQNETISNDKPDGTVSHVERIVRRGKNWRKYYNELVDLIGRLEEKRIAVKIAAEQMQQSVSPFTFHILPPSDEHPIYGNQDLDLLE